MDRVTSPRVPWETFVSRRSPGPSERIGDRGNVNYIEPHPPQPSSVPLSRNRPARAFFMPPVPLGERGVGSPCAFRPTPPALHATAAAPAYATIRGSH